MNVVQSDAQTEREKLILFEQEYQALTRKYGYKIVVVPAWKRSADLGTYSLILQPSLGRIATAKSVEKPEEPKVEAKPVAPEPVKKPKS